MQTNLFGEVKENGISIKQAAKKANVSTATIRNWIKTEYLTTLGKGIIAADSFDYFINNIAGKEKLNSRANKSLKDKHNHENTTNRIRQLIENQQKENIGTAYENSLSESFRNQQGIYYTPTEIVLDMLTDMPINSETTFLDPCCGSGNFIIEAIKLGVSPKNVYGFDTDPNAVLITQQRIRNEFGFETTNIYVGDFLKEASKLKQDNITFDLIFTNPPWGKKIEKSNKEKFGTLYHCGKSIDTTSLFLGASLLLLKQNGFLGFLVQEAFFNIATFEDIRRKVISKKILRFIDYGKPFKKLVTKAQAIIINNNAADENTITKCHYGKESYNRLLSTFRNNPKHIFNFWVNESDAKIIELLYSFNHIYLKNRAKWALGIVTGNNKKHCKETKENNNYIPVHKGTDISKNTLKDPSCFILKDFSSFQQVAPMEMYLAEEKLIYKFISSNLCFFYDNKQRFVLNSANIVIPVGISEITTKQVADLLNSEIVNWLFHKLFATHKILRSDLELLPIHIEYFKIHQKFSEEAYLNYLNLTKTKDGTFRIKD